MKQKSRKAHVAFLAGIYQGLAAPIMLFNTDEIPLDRRSDLEKMRSDLIRVGNDFNVAIKKATAHFDDKP